ncbi:MAG: GIY-YIG nuclease family protein [Candidatus Heimdallarchaeota archaeon]|nr:GIY-YIG nuclease family protein [Candidatus Heimdallarchaeota archaeon]
MKVNPKTEIKQAKGSYVLFFSNEYQINLTIGALGVLSFSPGNYIYIGSALGPGGLVKRIERHLQKSKKIFWHIDYLTLNNSFSIKSYFEIYSEISLECIIAKIVKESFNKDNIIIYKNFGSSDCCCDSHLFHIKRSIDEIISIIKPIVQKYRFKLIEINNE